MKRRLAAILAADVVVGYSRLMSADEAGTMAALDTAQNVFRRHVETHQGLVVGTPGDFVLALFRERSGCCLGRPSLSR